MIISLFGITVDSTEFYSVLGAVVILLILLSVRLAFGGCFRCLRSLESGATVVGQDYMTACVHTGHGGPEILQVETVLIPSFAKDELLVRVRAASINPVDFKFLSGKIKLAEALVGIPTCGAKVIPGMSTHVHTSTCATLSLYIPNKF